MNQHASISPTTNHGIFSEGSLSLITKIIPKPALTSRLHEVVPLTKAQGFDLPQALGEEHILVDDLAVVLARDAVVALARHLAALAGRSALHFLLLLLLLLLCLAKHLG